MTHTLPHRFSEKSFRRYERIIAASAERFPSVVVVNPADLELAGETVRGRLRDAIESYHKHNWTSCIDRVRFLMAYDTLVVSLRPDGKVAVGNKDTVKQQETVTFDVIDHSNVYDLTDKQIDIDLLCLLAHNQALKKRLKITIPTNEMATYLSENYDICLVKQPDNAYLLS